MTEQLKEICDLLVSNRDAVAKEFRFENNLMCVVAALVFTGQKKEADVERLKECRKILSGHTNMFSTYRKTIEPALLCGMALSEDPEMYIEDIINISHKAKKEGLGDDSFMILASMMIRERGKQSETDEIFARYAEIMKRMNSEHPVLTSSEDDSFVMLLALSDRNIDSILQDMEDSYTYLKKECKLGVSSDACQGISEIFAASEGDWRSGCDKTVAIFRAFAEKKADFGTDCTFLSLGALTDIDVETDTLVEEIIEAEACLKEHNGFGDSSADRKQRLMFAAFLVAALHGNRSLSNDNTAISNVLEIIKGKQTAAIINLIIQAIPSILSAAMGSKDSD